MDGAETSTAARTLALQRWGSQRLERMAAELIERRDELAPAVRDRLAAALAADTPDSSDGNGPAAA